MITEPNTEGESENSENAFVFVTERENAIVSGVNFTEPFVNHPGPIEINGVLLDIGRWNWVSSEQRWQRA